MFSRRAFLTTAGASAVILGVGGAGYVALSEPSTATEPWAQAGDSFGDPRLDALAYAILAPNPHNRQPWQFDLVDDDLIDVYCDLDKRLPETDPEDRQITIGFGCMIELLRQAAAEKGYRAEITPFPDGEPHPRLSGHRMAQIRFVFDPSASKDSLFQHAMQRRSNKEPFDMTLSVDAAHFSALQAVSYPDGIDIGGTLDTDMSEKIREIAWQGWWVEYHHGPTRRESIDVMRIGQKEINANPDGIDLGGTSMALLSATGILTREKLDTPGSQAFKSGIGMYQDIIDTSQGFVWVVSEGNSRLDQLNAGATWVRMNLTAQANGLALHPLSQVLQEFSEMSELHRSIHAELGATGDQTVQMLGRIGYANNPPASPRWPLRAKLINI